MCVWRGGWGEGEVAFALSISVAAIGNHFAFRNQLTSRASVVHLDLNVHLGMLQRWQLLRAFVATISTSLFLKFYPQYLFLSFSLSAGGR